MYKRIPNLHYARNARNTRFLLKRKIIKSLRQRPLTKAELKIVCNVQPHQRRSFDRALKDLHNLDIIRMDKRTQKIYAYGHEPPETVQFTVHTENLDVTIPAKKEQAAKVVEKDPLIKRNKEARIVLAETGLLENSNRQ
ncbi:MAG: hypothetical protein NZ932_04685 [Candidatus Bathyarchaeota archaeon]|nr:hypothetical protein [Candidatus Bathyarchaeota archaeon]